MKHDDVRGMYYDRQGKPISDTLTWARMMEMSDRRVAEDTLPDGRWLSTAWLGLNHNYTGGPPLIFESMLFPNKEDKSDLACWRWSTEEQAKEGHARIKAALLAGEDPADVD